MWFAWSIFQNLNVQSRLRCRKYWIMNLNVPKKKGVFIQEKTGQDFSALSTSNIPSFWIRTNFPCGSISNRAESATMDDACLIVHLLKQPLVFLPFWSPAKYLNMCYTEIPALFLLIVALCASYEIIGCFSCCGRLCSPHEEEDILCLMWK